MRLPGLDYAIGAVIVLVHLALRARVDRAAPPR